MNKKTTSEHPIAALSSVLLFGMFVLFLLIMLLFSSRIYQQTVRNTTTENNLGTSISYITTKFRQHDTENGIFSGKLNDTPALCFRDNLNGQEYITYLYVDHGALKELFTQSTSSATASAGTTIAAVSDFEFSQVAPDIYQFTITDSDGNSENFYLHQNSVSEEAS